MSDQPASTANNPELFDLAATALGCAPVHLLKVRQEGEQIVAILATGQKFVFDPTDVGAEILAQVQQIVAQLGPAPAPAAAEPPPAPKASKPKK
jgi:hypothetical protein